MGKRTFKNALATSATATDLAGNPDTHHPHAGELEIPTTPYQSDQAYNPDGSQTSMPAQDAKLSYEIFCDVCGIPVDDKKKLTRIDGRDRCRDCIDEE